MKGLNDSVPEMVSYLSAGGETRHRRGAARRDAGTAAAAASHR